MTVASILPRPAVDTTDPITFLGLRSIRKWFVLGLLWSAIRVVFWKTTLGVFLGATGERVRTMPDRPNQTDS